MVTPRRAPTWSCTHAVKRSTCTGSGKTRPASRGRCRSRTPSLACGWSAPSATATRTTFGSRTTCSASPTSSCACARSGFQGENEKKFPEAAAEFRKLNAEAKRLADEVKKRREMKDKPLDEAAKRELAEMERKSKALPEVARRVLHAETHHRPEATAFATVTSPLGTQSSKVFRLLGAKEPVAIPKEQDPRVVVAAWLRRPDNPYFAKAIVNRVWAHYFGRGLVDPPDHLSPFNPPSHPELLDELCREFIRHNYDLRWLHRTIVLSRTYQQSSAADPASVTDRTNYAFFYYRRLGAEVLLDALNQATDTTEDMDMKYLPLATGA